MEKPRIIYQEKQEIMGYFPKGRDCVYYIGILTITDKDKN